jgi:hypothetical protein
MTIDFTKLLGFDTVSHELSAGMDLRDDTLSDKLGARIGPEPGGSPAKAVDFQNETFAGRLGAKMGPGEPTDPCGH